jgi:hypothetical protein
MGHKLTDFLFFYVGYSHSLTRSTQERYRVCSSFFMEPFLLWSNISLEIPLLSVSTVKNQEWASTIDIMLNIVCLN